MKEDKEITRFRDNTIKLGYDFFKTKALLTAVRLDIFNVIGDRKVGLNEITGITKTDARAMGLLLDALVSLDLLQKEDGYYFNTRAGREVMVRGRDNYIGDIINLQADMWDAWNGLEGAIKTGRPIDEHDIFREYTEETEQFILAMHNTATGNAKIISQEIDLKGCKTMIDIGGGSGTYSIHFCRVNRGLKATVLDLPGTLQVTRRIISEAGMDKRVSAMEGDYNEVISGRYDAAFISNIIHCLGEAENRNLLKNTYGALTDKGVIIIQDFFLNGDKTSPPFAALFSLNMLLYTPRGRTYSFGEVTNWLREAGFRKIKKARIRMPRGISVMVGER